MNHADNCILSAHCQLAGGDKCNVRCSSFIACHGLDGAGGRIGAANVPAEYRGLTLATSPARADQVEAYKTAESYAHTFTRQFGNVEKGGAESAQPERIKSLYLYSSAPGTGKTTTAAALLNEYVIRHYIGSIQRYRQPLERPAYFLDVNEAQELYTEFTRPHVPADIAEPASREYYRRLQAAKVAPFAVLDDIGVRAATDGFRGDLHSVINHRVSNGLPSVYTSNVTLEEQVRVFDGRLADRIRDMCGVVEFVGASKRGLRR